MRAGGTWLHGYAWELQEVQGRGRAWGVGGEEGGVSLHYRSRFDIFLWALGAAHPTSAGVRPRFLLNFVRS
jgi:hypothetical protein